MPAFRYAPFRWLIPGIIGLSAATVQAQSQPDTARPAAQNRPLMVKVGVDLAHTWQEAWGVGLPLYAGAERQVARRWSVVADAHMNFITGNRSQPGPHLYELRAALGTRYYYNLAARARKGKPLRPLTGNYLQLQYTSDWEGRPTYGTDGKPRFSYQHMPNVEVLWGVQRRFGAHGFFDAGAGLRPQNRFQANPNTINHLGGNWIVLPTARLRVGLAF